MAIERQFSGTRPARPAPWRDPRVRSIVYQALTVIVVVLLVAYFVDNTLTNLQPPGDRRRASASWTGPRASTSASR